MADKVLIRIVVVAGIGVLLIGIFLACVVYKIQVSSQARETIMKSIPVHPNLTFFSRQTTGYPDAKPALIYSYRIDGKGNHTDIRDFYLKELKESGWKMKDTLMINSSKDYSLDYFEIIADEKNYKLTLGTSYETVRFILSRQ